MIASIIACLLTETVYRGAAKIQQRVMASAFKEMKHIEPLSKDEQDEWRQFLDTLDSNTSQKNEDKV